MTLLSVNVNKIATLRNARGHNMPNLANTTKDIIGYGARGITIHPRPDERHIKRQDVFELKDVIKEWNHTQSEKVEFNIEGYPSDDFMELVLNVKPDQCTLVPDPPEVLTSNAGWDCVKNFELLEKVTGQLKEHDIRSSLFIDPYTMNDNQFEKLVQVHPTRIELYTEKYAGDFNTSAIHETVETYNKVAIRAYDLGIGINAGHDLNLKNIEFLLNKIPVIEEVSIGHALICEALYAGLENTIKNYLLLIKHDQN